MIEEGGAELGMARAIGLLAPQHFLPQQTTIMNISIRKPAQVLENRLIDFATRILDLVEALPNTTVGRHLGGQTMRSGTAPALNYGEAQAAESKADFVHKMKICLKELVKQISASKSYSAGTGFQKKSSIQ